MTEDTDGEFVRFADILALAERASQPTEAGSVDTIAFNALVGAWLGGREYFQDDEHPTVQRDWEALIAHLNADKAAAVATAREDAEQRAINAECEVARLTLAAQPSQQPAPSDAAPVDAKPVYARCRRIQQSGIKDCTRWDYFSVEFADAAQGKTGDIPRSDMVDWQYLYLAAQPSPVQADVKPSQQAVRPKFCGTPGTGECSCAKFHDDPTNCERRKEWLSLQPEGGKALPDGWRDDLDLIRACVEGYPPAIARNTALATIRKLLSTPQPSDKLQQASTAQVEPASDLTTIPCPACDPHGGCDECSGQGRIIVSKRDMEAASATDAGPRFIANPDEFQTKLLHAMYKCAQRGDSVERMHFDVCQIIAAQATPPESRVVSVEDQGPLGVVTVTRYPIAQATPKGREQREAAKSFADYQNDEQSALNRKLDAWRDKGKAFPVTYGDQAMSDGASEKIISDVVGRYFDDSTAYADEITSEICAALAASQQAAEPVAWSYECRQPHTDPTIWCKFFNSSKPADNPEWIRNVTPLYRAASQQQVDTSRAKYDAELMEDIRKNGIGNYTAPIQFLNKMPIASGISYKANAEAYEVLAEIFTNANAYHKVEISFALGQNVTIRYDDMDEEWCKELREALARKIGADTSGLP